MAIVQRDQGLPVALLEIWLMMSLGITAQTPQTWLD